MGEQEITVYQGEVVDDQAITIYEDRAPGGEDLIITRWLEAKASRSPKTLAAYTTYINQLRACLHSRGLDLFSDSRAVSLVISAYASTSYDRYGRVNGQLSESTINQRLSVLSSFYTYARRFNVQVSNPVLLCDREKRQVHDAATHLEANEVEEALRQIDRKSLVGKRDYALLILALTTGRRASELVALTWGDIRYAGKRLEVTWRHCKGNKTMKDFLGAKTRAALEEWLHALYGKQLGQLANDAPVFVSFSNQNDRCAMGTRTVSRICQRYLGTGKVHTTRHTFAITNEQAGASLAEISDRLGHTDEKTTSVYLKRLHSAENQHIGRLEALYGL